MSNERIRKNMTNSFNHVMCRGVNQQNIFFEDVDYLTCFQILTYVVETYHCEIHCFCLMTNHIHLLIRTSHIPLKRVMQVFLSTYASYVNKKNNRVGHLFQGRYLSKAVHTDPYFLELLYYIHSNPLAAGIAKNLNCYRWSSHIYYANKKDLQWLTTSYLSQIISNSFKNYEDFLQTYTKREKNPNFCELDSLKILKIQQENKSTNVDLSGLRFFSFKQICEIVCEIFEIKLESLRSESQVENICTARAIAAYYAHFYGEYTLKYIAIELERNEKSFSRSMYAKIKNKKLANTIIRAETAFYKAIARKNLAGEVVSSEDTKLKM